MKYQFEHTEINSCKCCPMCLIMDYYHTESLICKAEQPYKEIEIKSEQTPPAWCRLEKLPGKQYTLNDQLGCVTQIKK